MSIPPLAASAAIALPIGTVYLGFLERRADMMRFRRALFAFWLPRHGRVDGQYYEGVVKWAIMTVLINSVRPT
jgi:hypothetical protein